MGDDEQQRPVRVCLTRCPLPPADESVHSLPCHIHHDGPAAIKSYFRPEQESDGSWRAEFRGVQLRGQRVSLQTMGMQGLVMEDAGMTHADDEGRIWEVDNHFEEMTFWQVPKSGDEDTNLPATLTEWSALAHASLSGVLAARHAGDWKLDGRSMRGPPRRRRHGPRSPQGTVGAASPRGSSSPSPPTPSPLAMRPTTRPTASPTPPITGDVVAPPSEEEAPLSSFSNPHAVEEEEPPSSPVTTSRHGTKRPRESLMCRRGSRDAGEGADRAVVALAPRTAIKTTRAWAFAAASASAHVTAAHSQAKALDQTIRARVQRLLIQFVMLPVVWVSLCCVITAAMGIEAMESIHKALVQDDEAPEPPAKKTKRNDPGLEQPTRRRGELPPPSDDECGLVFKLKTSPSAPDEALTPTPPASPPPRRRRRRVLIWDLDETLVLFASLYSGQFARSHGKDVATSVVLGEQMMTYLVAVLERHFFFSDLHNTDVEHISTATESAPSIAERYARIRAIYERRSATPVDFLDDPTSQWFTARQALVTSIDMLSTGWIREAHELLALTQSPDNDDEVVNVMVTNTQLSPALCKCLLYGLDAYFPIECVYSSSKVRKMRCFQTIMAKYAAAEDRDVEFIAIGDGPEEEQTSLALGLPFCKVRSLDDLRGLRYELQLVDETPILMAKTLPSAPPPVASSPPTAQCP